MSKSLKRIILIIIAFILCIPIKSLAVSNGNGKPTKHNNEIWISSYKGDSESWDDADTNGANVTYKVTKNQKFSSGLPRLMLTQGCLCLEHGKNVSHQTDNVVKARVYIEGKDAWVQKYNGNAYESIKNKQTVSGSGVSYKGQKNVFAEVAYIMARTPKNRILGKYGDTSAGDGGKRKELGRQGALWKISRNFMTQCGVNPEGSDYSGVWYNDNADTIYKEATSYASGIANYSEPKAQSTTINWNAVNNRFIIGPLKFKFSGGNQEIKIYKDSSEYSGGYICNSSGTKINSISSNTNFYISVGKDYTGGNVTLKTTRNVYVFDGYIFGDNVSDGQNQLFGYAENKNVSSALASITIVPSSLKIVKKDKDTGAVVNKPGFKFSVVGTHGQAYEIYTNDNGEAIQNPIVPDTYTITETSVGNNKEYDCNIYPVSMTANVAGDTTVNAVNEKYGWLKIVKTDKYTGAAMEGVTFTVTGANNYSRDVTTGADGTVTIKPIPKGTYTITEKSINTSIGKNWQYEASPYVTTQVTVGSGEAIAYLENEKVYINLSGKVFEDNQTNGKEGGQPGIYDNKDKVMQNIKVTLINKNNGAIIQGPQDTKADGSYIFKNVRIADLDKYSIKFEYDGLVWTNIPPTQTMSRTNAGSKAKEKETDRTKFNNGFATVVGNGDDTGKTIKTENGDARNLYYDATVFEKGKKSTLKKIYSDENGKIVIWDVKNEPLKKYYYPIEADTETAKLNYFNNLYNKSANNYYDYRYVTEIGNNNLGLMRREQPDIALVNDIENIKVSLNGESQIYQYRNRYKNLNETPQGYEVGVKFGNPYGSRNYTRPIYQSDYKFRNSDESKELQVFITYRLILKNQSAGLNAKVNNLANYYDDKFEFVAIGNQIDANGETISGTIDCDRTDTRTYGGKYTKMNITTPIEVPAQKEKCIYIRFKLTREKVANIIDINSDDNSQNDISIDNIAEITSYSIFDSSGSVYAGIDQDSNPGNATPGTMSTYEDDTDKCASLRLEMAVKRQMLGNVFEDKSLFENDQGLNTGQVREGNGIFDNSENTIKDVIVTYKEDKTGLTYKTKTLEKINVGDKFGTRKATLAEDIKNYNIPEDEATKINNGDIDNIKTYIIERITDEQASEANSPYKDYKIIEITNDDAGQLKTSANYCIADFIPGNYKVTYTWGDKEHTVQNWKATIFKKEREDPTRAPNNVSWSNDTYTKWYNEGDTRYTDAKDNYETRRIIDSETIYTKHNQATKDAIQAEYESPSGKYTIKMDSTSPGMQIGVEKKEALISQYEWDKPNLTNIMSNIDFGIIQRPKQILKLEKSIKSVKASLLNEQVIINALVKRDEHGKAYLDGDYKNVTYMEPVGTYNGTLKLELDNELIQGCKLDVEYGFNVRNISELDYADEGFYIYGTKQSMSEQEKKDKVIRLKPKAIVDYLDKEWSFTNQQMGIDGEYGIQEGADINNGWIYKELQELQKETGEKGQLIDSNVNANDFKVLYTEYLDGLANENIRLAPENNKFGEISSTEGLVFKVSKLLSNTDEIELDNNAEIISLEKTCKKEPAEPIDGATNKIENGGGAVIETTPGNFNPAKAEQTHELDDAKSETTVVTPATGENKNYIIPIGIGIIALITLGIGVLIIKKKTLTK